MILLSGSEVEERARRACEGKHRATGLWAHHGGNFSVAKSKSSYFSVPKSESAKVAFFQYQKVKVQKWQFFSTKNKSAKVAIFQYQK